MGVSTLSLTPRFNAGTGSEQTLRPEGTVESAPHIAWVVCDAMAIEKTEELFLESRRAVMFGLSIDIADCIFDGGKTDAERAVPLLPCEFALIRELIMDPS